MRREDAAWNDEEAGAIEDALSYYLMAAPTTEAEGAGETEIETARIVQVVLDRLEARH